MRINFFTSVILAITLIFLLNNGYIEAKNKNKIDYAVRSEKEAKRFFQKYLNTLVLQKLFGDQKNFASNSMHSVEKGQTKLISF